MRNERMMITSLRLSQIRRLSHSHAFFELPSSSPAWSVAFIVTCCHILMMDSYAKSSSNFPMASSDLRLLWVARCRDQPWHREMAPRVINLGVDRCPIGIFTSTWLQLALEYIVDFLVWLSDVHLVGECACPSKYLKRRRYANMQG